MGAAYCEVHSFDGGGVMRYTYRRIDDMNYLIIDNTTHRLIARVNDEDIAVTTCVALNEVKHD